jgi:hypothetical protein
MGGDTSMLVDQFRFCEISSFVCGVAFFVWRLRKAALSIARQNRRNIFNPSEVGCFHAVQRTVRRAWCKEYVEWTGHPILWIQQ